MSSNSGFLDEQGMIELARKAIEDLRRDGVAPTEVKRLENVLKEGGVGEAFILANLLRTILGEMSPDASQKKLLQVYRGLEECCNALVELSRNLFDVEVWQHYRASGYESFDSYCTEALGIPAPKIQSLRLIKDLCLPVRKKAGPVELFTWFFNVIDVLAGTRRGHVFDGDSPEPT